MSHKAIALLSGGLDSTLAVRLILDQGITVEALNFVTPFCTCNRRGRCEARAVAEQLGIAIQTIPVIEPLFEAIKSPKHGYGSGMNPCLDCRILMFTRARERLEESEADFVFTGEVLGQRPMSQHLRAMRLIDAESGLTDRVLRPLSAKLLPPTYPERVGIVQREKLLAIHGRSRKEQMALAERYHMADYPCPAGGCRLTDPSFSRRMRDLVTHTPDFDLNDVNLLRVGRHFRLSPACKAVVGRDEEENRSLRTLARSGDVLLEVPGVGSPLVLLRGETLAKDLEIAAAITARYSDAVGPDVVVAYGPAGGDLDQKMGVRPIEEAQLVALRV